MNRSSLAILRALASPLGVARPPRLSLLNEKDAPQIYTQSRNLRLYREKTVRAMYWRGRSLDRVKYSERRRDEYQDWNYRSEIYAFSRRLQENLSEDTLRSLFAHRSYVEKVNKRQAEMDLPAANIKSNEEMIMRGEQLLDHCIKPYLRYLFDKLPEDGVSAITNYLKSESVLADMASWFGCNDIILSGEWPPSDTTKANTVRALLSAIEQDLGEERVQRFVVDMIISYLNDKNILDDVWIIPNPKEVVNRILDSSGLPSYEPRIMFQTGMRTLEPCHVVGIYVNQKFMGSSAGETLQIAEECAALNTLQRIFDLGETRQPFIYGEASEKIDYKAHRNETKYLKDYTIKLE